MPRTGEGYTMRHDSIPVESFSINSDRKDRRVTFPVSTTASPSSRTAWLSTLVSQISRRASVRFNKNALRSGNQRDWASEGDYPYSPPVGHQDVIDTPPRGSGPHHGPLIRRPEAQSVLCYFEIMDPPRPKTPFCLRRFPRRTRAPRIVDENIS